MPDLGNNAPHFELLAFCHNEFQRNVIRNYTALETNDAEKYKGWKECISLTGNQFISIF